MNKTNNWKKGKLAFMAISCIFVLTFLSFIPNNSNLKTALQQENTIPENIKKTENRTQINASSLELDRAFFESILQEQINSYSQLGYYPTVHPPSLHATYYALDILNSLGKLDKINITAITEYIMSHYNDTTGIFYDEYTARYLDTDVDKSIPPPLTSQLEINCYAVLALSILGELEQIDAQKMISFIWSCQNLTEGGFIGQPVKPELLGALALPTADNTYFAVQALNCLLSDWSAHALEKNKIITFLISLQSEEAGVHLGGFHNDKDPSHESLIVAETNLLAAYYCIKILDLWDATFHVNSETFGPYLEYLYNPTSYFFVICPKSNYFYHDYYNLGATALGLDLARVMGYTFTNNNEILAYLLNHRNSMGIWDKSIYIPYHEIIYTYQIVRSITGAGQIGVLDDTVKSEIAEGVDQFYFHDGFSLMSADYTSQARLNALVNAVSLSDTYNVEDLAISYIQDQIQSVFTSIPSVDVYYFLSHTKYDGAETFYHTRPIEYCTTGTHSLLHEFNDQLNSRSMFHALDTVHELQKLEEFEIQSSVSANDLINGLVACQFLDSGYSNEGGFSPHGLHAYYDVNVRNKFIYLEHDFYTIKSLEVLVNYLGGIELTSLPFDKEALAAHVLSHLSEDSAYLYFVPSYTTEAVEVLQTTYQCIYILKAIDQFNLDTQKIRNYLLQHLNPSTMEELYYTYKIDEFLNLGLPFDWEYCADFLKSCYSDSLHEFFNSPEKDETRAHYFNWVFEMLAKSSYTLTLNYSSSVPLDTSVMITAIYSNLMGDAPSGVITMELDSPQLGIVPLEQDTNIKFSREIFVPWTEGNYPEISGTVRVKSDGWIIAEQQVSIETFPRFDIQTVKHGDESSVELSITVSLLKKEGSTNIMGTQVKTEVYRNAEKIPDVYPSIMHYSTYSIIHLSYTPEGSGTFTFNLSLEHPSEQWTRHLMEETELFFTILKPTPMQYCNTTPPELCLEVPILDLDEIWYTLDWGITNHSFTENGTITSEAWEPIDTSIPFLTVYVNDTHGNLANKTIPLMKDTILPIFWLPFLSENDSFGFLAPILEVEIWENTSIISAFYQLINPLNLSQYTELIPFNPLEPLNISQEEWEVFSDGLINLTLYATDSAGNVAMETHAIIKDTTSPVFSWLSLFEHDIFGIFSPLIEVEIWENTSIISAFYQLINPLNLSQYTELIPFNPLEPLNISQEEWEELPGGPINITLYATDSAGNVAMETHAIIKDSTSPAITIQDPERDSLHESIAPYFSISVDEAMYFNSWYYLETQTQRSENVFLVGIEAGYINNDAWNAMNDGFITINFRVQDFGGNIGSASVKVIKDTFAPDFDIVKPSSNQVFGSNPPSFELDIREPNFERLTVALNGRYRWEYDSADTILSLYWISIGEGVVILDFRVEDKSGHETSKSVAVIKDRSSNTDNPFDLLPDDPDLDDTEESVRDLHVGWGIWYGVNVGLLFLGCLMIRRRSLTKFFAQLSAIPPPLLIGLMWLIKVVPAMVVFLSQIYVSIYLSLGAFLLMDIFTLKKGRKVWKERKEEKIIDERVAKTMLSFMSMMNEKSDDENEKNKKGDEE